MPNTNERDGLPRGSADAEDLVVRIRAQCDHAAANDHRLVARFGEHEGPIAIQEGNIDAAIEGWRRALAATAPNAGATNNAIPKTNPLSGGKCLHGVSMADHCQSCVGTVAAPNAGAPRGSCGNSECGWSGALPDCRYLGSGGKVGAGSVGPLCPECGEVVEPDAAAPAQQTGAPLADETPSRMEVDAWRRALLVWRDATPAELAEDTAGLRQCLPNAARLLLDHPALAAALAQQAGAPLTEEALQRIAEELGRSCHVWEGIGARDVEAVLKLAQKERAPLPLAPSEHYDEVKATLLKAHALCENISGMERRVGTLGSHARGLTWGITNALKHLDALATPPQATLPASEPVAIVDISVPHMRTFHVRMHPDAEVPPVDTLLYTRAQPQADAAEPVARDAQRLDYLQVRGATVEILPDGPGWKFRIGGLHKAVSHDVRSAIDFAIAAQAPGARGLA